MGGGAWPFLVGGVICLLNCDNGRDSCVLLVSRISRYLFKPLQRTTLDKREEETSNNRSVMPLDVLGHTRATMTKSTSFFLLARKSLGNLVNLRRDGARVL